MARPRKNQLKTLEDVEAFLVCLCRKASKKNLSKPEADTIRLQLLVVRALHEVRTDRQAQDLEKLLASAHKPNT